MRRKKLQQGRASVRLGKSRKRNHRSKQNHHRLRYSLQPHNLASNLLHLASLPRLCPSSEQSQQTNRQTNRQTSQPNNQQRKQRVQILSLPNKPRLQNPCSDNSRQTFLQRRLKQSLKRSLTCSQLNRLTRSLLKESQPNQPLQFNSVRNPQNQQ